MDNSASSVGTSSEGVLNNEMATRNKRKFLSDTSLNIQSDAPQSLLEEFPRCENLEERLRNASTDSSWLEDMDNSASSVGTSSEGVLNNEMASRNKQKFLSDTSLNIQSDAPQSLLEEFPRCENLDERLRNASTDSSDQEGEEFLRADWEDSITCQLQELLLNNLLTIFNGAVKKIVESGYTSEVAEWAILNSGIFHGSKDSVSNVVDGALALLKGKKAINLSSKYSIFKKLPNLASYTMLEMIHVLREVRPTLTIHEAMWCLLMSDMNLLNACVFDKPDLPQDSAKLPIPKAQASGTNSSDSNHAKKSQTNSRPGSHPENSKSRPVPMDPRKDSSLAFQHGKEEESLANSRRDILLQKAFQLEKNYKGFKARLAAWGSSVSISSAVVMKETSGSRVESSARTPFAPDNDPAPASNPNSPAPPAPDSNPSPKEENTIATPPEAIDDNASVPEGETDEAVLMLLSHKKRLEKDLKGWTDWANEKVMQAAKRLAKDRPEMKMLRQEKEEAEKCVREKQALEKSTMKRISDMECALSNANEQIEVANINVEQMEEDNLSLKLGMKRIELESARSVHRLQEAAERVQETEKKVKLGEMEKGSLVEKSKKYKTEMGELEKKVMKAKERWDQFKILLKNEEKETARIAAQVDLIRAKKEEDKEQAEREAESLRQAAATDLQQCRKDIGDLEKAIAVLRLESNKSRIAALSMGFGSSSSSGSGALFPKVTKRLPVFQDNFGGESVKPERECVMCMTEEISVVFLPCAHQVLCGGCSERHERQGMKDCPCCRTVIQERILAKYGDR